MNGEELLREALARAARLLETDAEFCASAPDPAILARLAGERSSAELVLRAAELYAARPAFALRATGAAGGRRLSYAELGAQVAAFATGLAREKLLARGDFLALVAFGGPGFVIAELAAVYLGATALPLQTNLAPGTLAAVLRETQARVVVCDADQLPLVASVAAECPSVRAVLALASAAGAPSDVVALRASAPRVHFTTFDAVAASGAGPAAPLVRPGRGEDPLRAVVYTSGSTGTPKGALFPESIYVQKWLPARARSYPFLPDFPLPLPVGFVFSPLGHQMGSELVAASLVRGALTHLAPDADVSHLFEDFRAARPAFIGFVPRVAQRIYDDFRAEVARQSGFTGERATATRAAEEVMHEMRERYLGDRLLAATSASAPIGADVLAFLRACFRIPAFNLMGMTEAGGFLFDGRIRRDNVLDFRLVDVPEKGFSASDRPFSRGELWLKTRRQVPGYFASEEATRATFSPEGYLRTGDVFELRGDEQLAWVARKNQVLKLAHGKFVNTGALEALFTTRSALVRQAYVYGKSERAYLLAVLVPDLGRARALLPAGAAADAAELHALLGAELRRIAKEAGLRSYEVPRDFLVELEPWSRENGLVADNGKPSLAKLAARYALRLDAVYERLEHERSAALRAVAALPPEAPVADKLERALAAVVELTVPPAGRGGLTFSELGGDSINAVALAALLDEEWRLRLPVGLILSPSASIDELARYLERTERAGADAATADTLHGAGSAVLRASDVTLAGFVPAAELTPAAGRAARRRSRAPRTVMLTGASGFLGRFVLLELLERPELASRVVGLVRAKDDAAARARVAASFATDPELVLRFESLARRGALEIIAGDLMLPELGLPRAAYERLAAASDTVIHAGALVNHALGYDELFEPNVRGTAEIARLALRGAPKSVAFVSTVGLAEGRAEPVSEHESAGALWPERARFGGGPGYGYTSTKWASELLLAELDRRGGAGVQLLRATNLMAHPRYRGQVNAEDFLSRLLGGLALAGVAPASFYAEGAGARAFDGVPVDAAARAVVEAALGEPERTATYHLAGAPDGDVSLDTIVDCLSERVPLERVADYAAWYRSFTQRLAALDADHRRRSPLSIVERWEEPRLGGARLEHGRAFELPALTRSFIHKSLDDLGALGVL